VTRRWDQWYLGGIWLSALGLAALADRVEGERLRGEDAAVDATVRRGGKLIERARTAIMGADRPMGPGWLRVSPDGLSTDEQLAFWTRAGLDHRTASPDGPGTR
jgi:hypothetical protein